nr:Multidrug resistance-associated protein 4 [Polyrhizophydium stewartii]
MAAPLSKSKSQLSASSARLRSSSSQKVFPSASMDLDGCEPATTISPQAREACVAVHFPANTPQESRDVLLPLEEPTRSLSAGQHPLPPPRTGHMQRQLSESSGLAAIASRSGAASPVVASDAASRVGIPVTGSGRSSRGRVSSDGAKGMSQAAEPSFAIEMSAAKGGFRNSAAEPKAIKKPHEASAIPMSPSLSSFKSRSQTNLYQQISFSYMNDLIKQGSRREILVEEYPPVENDDDAGDASHRILTAWRQEHAQRGSAASLWRVLRKVYGWQYTGIGLLFLFETFVKIAESFLLGLLLDWFDSGTDASEGYARAAALSSAVIIHALINQYKFFLKCLSLPLAQVSSSGQIINMISNELQRIEDAAGFAFYIVIGPIEALLVFYFVYEQIGLAAVAAVGALLMLVPLQSVFANQFAVLRRATNVHRDNRTKSITDMIAGMLVVKLYAWELPFIGRIKDLRDKELASIRKASVLRALNEAIFFASSSIVSMFAFVSFYFLGGVLTASNVFTCLTYLQTVRQTMTNLFSKGLQFSSEAMVSLQRVQQFLLRPEFEKRSSGPADMVNLKEFNHPSTAIAIKDGSFSWKPGTKAKQERAVEIQCSDAKAQAVKMPPLPPRAEPDLVLRNIDLCVRFGELLGVCGPVGSGKTSLINAILGEIECVSGFVAVRSQSIAYVSQSAWILPGTIKDNILFGRAYREEWFWEVVRACALEADIERLSMREHTFLGERGFTVSGGQRARIALARAVYADAEVYLLDDPLSAVDPHCIRGVLKRKAVILVTHLLQYVERCNEVLLLESGAMVQSGKFGRVASVEGSAFAAVMREYSVPEGLDAIAAKANSTAAAAKMQKEQSRRVVKTSVMGLGGATTSMPGGNSAHVDESPGASPFNSGNSTMGTAIGKKVLLDSSQTQPPRKNAFDETDDSDDDLSEADIEALRISLAKRKSIVKSQTPTEPKPEANDLAAEAAKANKTYNTEDVKRGSVSSRIYIDYLAAGAPALSIVCLVALLFAGEMLLLATDWWLSRWATMSAGTQQNPQNLYVFAALAFSTLLVSILRAVWFFSICIAASKELFSKMLSNVFAAPMSFFQANPQGRLIK